MLKKCQLLKHFRDTSINTGKFMKFFIIVCEVETFAPIEINEILQVLLTDIFNYQDSKMFYLFKDKDDFLCLCDTL